MKLLLKIILAPILSIVSALVCVGVLIVGYGMITEPKKDHTPASVETADAAQASEPSVEAGAVLESAKIPTDDSITDSSDSSDDSSDSPTRLELLAWEQSEPDSATLILFGREVAVDIAGLRSLAEDAKDGVEELLACFKPD